MAKINKKQTFEGRVYNCSWKKNAGQYVLTCVSPPVGSLHKNFEEAKEILLNKIMDATGDGEAHLAFIPPVPKKAKTNLLFCPQYFSVGFQDFVDWHNSSEKLFEHGNCSKCGTGLGMRTKTPRVITSAPRYDIVGFRLDKNASWMISEDVASHIAPFLPEKGLVEVEYSKDISRKKAKRFYELAFQPEVKQAIPKQYEQLSGWRCQKCMTQVVLFSAKTLVTEKSIFVIRQDVNSKVLLLGHGPFLGIAVDNELNDNMAQDKHIKGYLSRRIAMLDQEQALSKEDVANLPLSVS